MSQTLVSVGVPVRNGGTMLASALDALAAQDYSNIEVIISDNCSNDETPNIANAFAVRHPNARVIRQAKPISAFQNFMGLIDEAQGEYFLWCAHDDLRSSNFVSSMVTYLEANREASLCFCDLRVTDQHGTEGVLKNFDFANGDLCPFQRLRKQALMQCFHIYGLWRKSELKRLPKNYCSWWPDLPLMLAAAYSGTFGYVSGATFTYLEVSKTDAERAQYQDFLTQGRSRVVNLMNLSLASFRSVREVANFPVALMGALFILEKQVRGTLFRIFRFLNTARRSAPVREQ